MSPPPLSRTARLGSFVAMAALAAMHPLPGWSQAIDGHALVEAQDRYQRQLFADLASSVVFLATPDGFGSGFFVSADGLILTNAHVVAQHDSVEVVLLDGRRYTGEVVERARDKVDLALVRIPAASTPALEFGPSADLEVGTWVATVNHGAGGIWSFSTGMVSNIYPDGSERPVFQTQLPINPGASGGPIVDHGGRVLGVVTARMEGAENMNFGIRIDVALQTLPGLDDMTTALVITAPDNVPVFVDGAMVGVGPRVVIDVESGTHEVMAIVDGEQIVRSIRYPETRRVDLD
jgi:serine protease Do